MGGGKALELNTASAGLHCAWLTDALELQMFGEGELSSVHRVGGDLRALAQPLTDKKLSLREVKQAIYQGHTATGW